MRIQPTGTWLSGSKPSRPGFTLIELLIVVAILAILAALLFPVFGAAKESARKTVCASHLRQLGAAIQLYAADHDDAFPNTGDPYLWVGRRWRWPILPYAGTGHRRGVGFDATNRPSANPFVCPSDFVSPNQFDATSYAFSAAFYNSPHQIAEARIRNLIASLGTPGPLSQTATQTTSSVAQPAAKSMLTEWFNSHDSGGGSRVGFWGTLRPGLVPGDDRWNGGRNHVFADGHAAWLQAKGQTPSAEDCPDINLTPGGVHGVDLRRLASF
ncbi:MAG: DUF1559 domain-containing protein [Fimbriimonadales bacterium]|nr:DUF1559 domain-containing protein [Fimbriimonadales bacterium]